MRILIISQETWRNDTNGGNVLTNIFSDFDAEFAQIFCSAGLPDNNICKKYFQMTDSMALRNIIKKVPMGRVITSNENEVPIIVRGDNEINRIKRLGSYEFLRVAREMVWAFSDYRNEEMKEFILDFSPDVIFAPYYGVTYMLTLTDYVSALTKKPVISYISDDSYSLRQFNISIAFWINRFVIRRKTRKTWSNYSLIYTMTETQKEFMSKLGKPMKILCKSGEFESKLESKSVGTPIRLIYGGGLYLNRWQTVLALAKAIKKLNVNKKRFVLDIYTNTVIPRRAEKILNDGVNCWVHPAIPYEKLQAEYKKSDIALHVESFSLKDRLNVRMSFSTKIVDCLNSGCAVMAICDKKQGGYVYLQENDAAICVDSLKDLERVLCGIYNDTSVINNYRLKAYECGRKNHLREDIISNLKRDFEVVIRRGHYEDSSSN